MNRATKVLPAGTWDRASEADRIALTHDNRHRRRIVMKGEGGTDFLLDLPEAMHLRDGDGLALEDSRIVRVVAAAEPVLEIVGDAHLLSRLSWHIGNRHVPAQILPDRIRIAQDHVLEEMLVNLGAKVAHAMAPFDPEPGAYAGEAHGHGHGPHDHDHDDHDHSHGHAHARAHGHRHEH
jgi:urease accessory protein